MLKNLLLVSLRSLLRYRTFSLMNILGLTLGIAFALFIFLLVRYERSYDQFHAKKDRIYRIVAGSPDSPIEQFDTGTPNGVATYLLESRRATLRPIGLRTRSTESHFSSPYRPL